MSSSIDLARMMRSSLQTNTSVNGPWQWGTVESQNGDGTVNVYLDNNTGPVTRNIACLNSVYPDPGQAVMIARMQGLTRSSRVIIGVIGVPAVPPSQVVPVTGFGRTHWRPCF